MKDMIPKGTGNSRFLRSVSNFKAIYPTYDDFVNALVAGNLPVDFNGINEAGIQQVGTSLNKANLLTDETATALGLTSEDPTVDDAFGRLNQHLTDVEADGLKMAVGTYAGTGKSGSSYPCSITLGFKPKLLIVDDVGLSADSKTGASMIAYFSDLTNSYANKVAATRSVQNYTDSLGGLYFENENSYLFFKFDGTKLYWHYTRSSVGTDTPILRQCNNSGHTFLFRAFG